MTSAALSARTGASVDHHKPSIREGGGGDIAVRGKARAVAGLAQRLALRIVALPRHITTAPEGNILGPCEQRFAFAKKI